MTPSSPIYLVTKAPSKIKIKDKWSIRTDSFSLLRRLYGFGTPIIVAKEEIIRKKLKDIGYSENFDIKIINSKNKVLREKYVKFLFNKLQRKEGLLERDCDKMIRNDRVIWASCMVECGDADAMVTGNTRRYSQSLEKIKKVIPPRKGEIMFGLNMVVSKGKTVFIGDTSVNEYPSSEELADTNVTYGLLFKYPDFQIMQL